MSSQPPDTVQTRHGPYEWQHQMDYHKNGILHYYLIDEDGELVETDTGRSAQAVTINWPAFNTWGMSAKQIAEFCDAWDEQVDLRYIRLRHDW